MYYIIVNKLVWEVREFACYNIYAWSPLHPIVTFVGGGIILLNIAGD